MFDILYRQKRQKIQVFVLKNFLEKTQKIQKFVICIRKKLYFLGLGQILALDIELLASFCHFQPFLRNKIFFGVFPIQNVGNAGIVANSVASDLGKGFGVAVQLSTC